MPSIFNDEEQKKIHSLLDVGFDSGSNTVAKGVAKGFKGIKKIMYFVIAGITLSTGFIIGCLHISAHFKQDKLKGI